MEIQKIGEPIRVVAECAGGQIEPLRFTWSGRTFEISDVNGRWIDRTARGYRLCYSVQARDQTFYLHFDSVGVQWWVDQVVVE